jgi:hypothetical protein
MEQKSYYWNAPITQFQGEIAMQRNAGGKLSKSSRQVAIAIVASAVVAATAVSANPSNNTVLVPPTRLPELARQSGDAMLLHETSDGRTLLYIEQNLGALLATFDVTDPVYIKDEGSVQLDTAGPFDFVSPLGKQAELIRFRQGHEAAVLDLHKEKVPNLKVGQGLTLRGPITHLGNDGFTVTSQASQMQPAQEHQVVETANAQDLRRAFDVKQVREEVTNASTGTTFLLTENGLFLIRRPAVESEKRRREQEWFWEHTGG